MKHTNGKTYIHIVDEKDIYIVLKTGQQARIASYDGDYDFIDEDAREANAIRANSLWNAADGMTTEEAVRYIEHGREMVAELLKACTICGDSRHCSGCSTKELLEKKVGLKGNPQTVMDWMLEYESLQSEYIALQEKCLKILADYNVLAKKHRATLQELHAIYKEKLNGR